CGSRSGRCAVTSTNSDPAPRSPEPADATRSFDPSAPGMVATPPGPNAEGRSHRCRPGRHGSWGWKDHRVVLARRRADRTPFRVGFLRSHGDHPDLRVLDGEGGHQYLFSQDSLSDGLATIRSLAVVSAPMDRTWPGATRVAV